MAASQGVVVIVAQLYPAHIAGGINNTPIIRYVRSSGGYKKR